MKYFVSILFLFFTLNTIEGQSNKQIYGELLGNGILIGSVNYDQRLTGADEGLGFRVGVDIAWLSPAHLTFPIMLNYLVGSKHQLEIGAGVVFITSNISFSSGDDLNGIAYLGSLMYRLNFDNGYVFRIGYTPIIDNTSLPIWFGMSLGHKF